MMRRSIAVFLVASVSMTAGIVGAVHADLDTAGVRVQIGWVAGWDDGAWAGTIELRRAPEASAIESALEAEAFYEYCDSGVCEFRSFPAQPVEDSGLELDPIGNSATIDICLEADSGGGCEPFVFVLTRPSTMQVTSCCTPSPWYDASAAQVGLDAETSISLSRTGYYVDADGSRVGFNSSVAWATSLTEQVVGLTGHVEAP